VNSEGPHISGADDGTAALRGAMVDRLKPHIIRDPRIEAAFRAVPRHLFLPTVPLEKVYSGDVIPTRFDDKRVPISSSSEVAVMAVMIEQLELVEGQRVLEIGAGTGYNAAIIAQLVRGSGRVTTIDIDPEIAAEARARLDVAGYERVHVVAADGWDGLKDEAPHDRIVLTASTGDLSPAWVEQLADHGILLVPLWMRAGWQMLVAFRRHDGALRSVSTRGGGFMALRGIGAPVNPGVSRNNFHVVGAHQEDFDGIFALLETDPNLVLGPPYEPLGSFERQTALGAAGDELISISHVGRGRGLGLYDRTAKSLAVATFTFLAHLGPRIAYLTYGDAAPLMAIRALVEDGPQGCDEIEVEAVRLSSPASDGGVLRRHFRPLVRVKES
jgi:protein-L-isoaspartate(D-aspartate) O-methyltransferase